MLAAKATRMLALFVASIVFVYQPVLKKLRNLGQCQADCRFPHFETILRCMLLAILGCQYLPLQTCGAMLSVNQAGSEAIVATSSSGTVNIEIQTGRSTTEQEEQKVETGRPPDASNGVVKVEPSSEATDSRPADGKLATAKFEEQVALWARQCAGFRKRATWMPTRPGAGFQEKDWFGP